VKENGVEVRTFPDEIVAALGKATMEVFADIAATDELTGRVHRSFMDFLVKADEYAMRFDARMLAMRHAVLTA
jgi:TRAP-type mannitol/chloroaromatic compound transport system substrate-binding protein